MADTKEKITKTAQQFNQERDRAADYKNRAKKQIKNRQAFKSVFRHQDQSSKDAISSAFSAGVSPNFTVQAQQIAGLRDTSSSIEAGMKKGGN
jgi:hypothetical protein